jgi:uncharacterized membrane protein YkoI
MSLSTMLLATALAGLWAMPGLAAERCLSAKERRSAIAKKEALPLERAVHDVRGQLGGDIVRARLCQTNHGLVYLLTVLARDGKVSRASVHAVDGRLVANP